MFVLLVDFGDVTLAVGLAVMMDERRELSVVGESSVILSQARAPIGGEPAVGHQTCCKAPEADALLKVVLHTESQRHSIVSTAKKFTVSLDHCSYSGSTEATVSFSWVTTHGPEAWSRDRPQTHLGHRY